MLKQINSHWYEGQEEVALQTSVFWIRNKALQNQSYVTQWESSWECFLAWGHHLLKEFSKPSVTIAGATSELLSEAKQWKGEHWEGGSGAQRNEKVPEARNCIFFQTFSEKEPEFQKQKDACITSEKPFIFPAHFLVYSNSSCIKLTGKRKVTKSPSPTTRQLGLA